MGLENEIINICRIYSKDYGLSFSEDIILENPSLIKRFNDTLDSKKIKSNVK